jgi:hypothetical protein
MFLISLILLVSCHEESDVRNNLRSVKIYESVFPENGLVNQPISLLLKAEATNGCYSDFKFSLKKVEDFKYEITATARYQSNGACPDVMVYADSTIQFTTAVSGEYLFLINKTPFEVVSKKIIIN